MMNKLIAWVEIPCTDFKRAVQFYNKAFNIDLQVFENESEKMACFPGGEGAISMAKGFNPSPDGVLVSFRTPDSIEKTLERVNSLNGNIVQAKTKIEADNLGYFALFIDSEGNKVGLYSEN